MPQNLLMFSKRKRINAKNLETFILKALEFRAET